MSPYYYKVTLTIFLTFLIIFYPLRDASAEVHCIKSIFFKSGISEKAERHYRLTNPSGRRPVYNQTCMSLLISGEIVEGDADKFLQLLKASFPFTITVYLSSAGGNAIEAMRIGRLIRKYFLKTEAPITWGSMGGYLLGPIEAQETTICRGHDCICASACFLIWAAGVDREGDMLGMHRPSIKSAEFTKLSPDKAATVYKKVLLDIRDYLKEMEIPSKYIEAMTDTGSNDIYWLNPEGVFKKEVFNLKTAPSVEETFESACVDLSGQKKDELTELMQDADNGNLTNESEEKIGELLKRKIIAVECRTEKYGAFRDKIETPSE